MKHTKSQWCDSMMYILLVAAALSCTGCLSPHSVQPHRYPIMPDKPTNPVAFAQPDPLEGQWHSMRVLPTTRARITTCDKLNPAWWLGNADEPTPPDWYRPHAKMRTFLWHLRNPIHNFSHYVVGVCDKETVRSGKHVKGVANPNGGWNFSVTKYKHLRLPFADYHRGKFEFYFGWRVGGNFGIKCNWHDEKPKPKKTEGDSNYSKPMLNSEGQFPFEVDSQSGCEHGLDSRGVKSILASMLNNPI